MRLQKLLSRAGVASRRKAEDLIREGRVTVSGKIAQVGDRASFEDDVRVDGGRVVFPPDRVYVAFNKPEGVISTTDDPEGRTTVTELVGMGEKLILVGRLDAGTTGVILLTNDGDLAHKLMHPRHHIPRTYVAEVAGSVSRAGVKALLSGVDIGDDRPARALHVEVLDRRKGQSPAALLEIVVQEGRNRLVRRMLEGIGHPVRSLTRTAFGPIELGRLKAGGYRNLSPDEITALHEAVEEASSHD